MWEGDSVVSQSPMSTSIWSASEGRKDPVKTKRNEGSVVHRRDNAMYSWVCENRQPGVARGKDRDMYASSLLYGS